MGAAHAAHLLVASCTVQGCQAARWPPTCWHHLQMRRNCVASCTAQQHAVERSGMACYHPFCAPVRIKPPLHSSTGVEHWRHLHMWQSALQEQADGACHHLMLRSYHCFLLPLTGQAPQSRQVWPGGVWVRMIIAWRLTQRLIPLA